MLNSSQRVRANLARRAFDANVSRYAAVWANGRQTEVAHLKEPVEAAPEAVAAPAVASPATASRKPNNYFLPSADSIPSVSIMSPEPVDAPADKPKAATAEAARKPPTRPSASVTANAANSTAARAPTAPIPLTPGR
jgi:hypothetical protein